MVSWILDKLDELLSDKTRIVALTHASNSLGTINPVKEVIQKAHAKGYPGSDRRSADGAAWGGGCAGSWIVIFTSSPRIRFSGPPDRAFSTERRSWLEKLPPYQGGGDMVDQVTFERTTYNTLPFKFEAGTTNYIGAIGLAAALDYLQSIGFEAHRRYEKELTAYTLEKLGEIDRIEALRKCCQTDFGLLLPAGRYSSLRCRNDPG